VSSIVLIERDEDGFYVGEVPGLSGCYSQGRSVDELLGNIREATALCLEEDPDQEQPKFVTLATGEGGADVLEESSGGNREVA